MKYGYASLQKPKVRSVIRLTLGLIAATAFLYSIGMIANKLIDQTESKRSYKQIQAIYHKTGSLENPLDRVRAASIAGPHTVASAAPPDGSTRHDGFVPNNINNRFGELLKTNKDTVGWLNIPNTNMDYPVVQSADNEYYLDHSFERKKNSAGAIFMDYRNDSRSVGRNTILYGHHMKDGSMFKHLIKYLDERFFKENPMITFDDLVHEQKWEVFSAYVTDTGFDYIQTKFDSDDEYLAFLKAITERSEHKTDVALSLDDKILTLSTCSYEFNNARMVVHAKLISSTD